jgi:hypothetical protein
MYLSFCVYVIVSAKAITRQEQAIGGYQIVLALFYTPAHYFVYFPPVQYVSNLNCLVKFNRALGNLRKALEKYNPVEP